MRIQRASPGFPSNPDTAADRSKDYVEISEDELAAFLAPHLPKAVSARLLAARLEEPP